MDYCLPFSNQCLRWFAAQFSHGQFDLKNRGLQYQNVRVNIFLQSLPLQLALLFHALTNALHHGNHGCHTFADR